MFFSKGILPSVNTSHIKTPGRREGLPNNAPTSSSGRVEGKWSVSLTKWPDIWFAAKAAEIKHLRWTPLHRKFSTRRTRVLIIQDIPRVRHWVTISILYMSFITHPPTHPRIKTQSTEIQQASGWSYLPLQPGLCNCCLSLSAWDGNTVTFYLHFNFSVFLFHKAVEATQNKSLQTFFKISNLSFKPSFIAFLMIQRLLPIWSLIPLPFLKPAWTSGISWFTYCWSLAWRILSVTLLACEMSAIVW